MLWHMCSHYFPFKKYVFLLGVCMLWGTEEHACGTHVRVRKNCVVLVLFLHLYMDSRDQTPTQMLSLAQKVPWPVEPS